MGFIGNDQTRRGDVHGADAVVGADCDSVGVRPGVDGVLFVVSVGDEYGEVEEAFAFAGPVNNDGCGYDDEGAEVFFGGGKVCSCGEGLDCFAESHVVAEEGFLLDDGEAGAE